MCVYIFDEYIINFKQKVRKTMTAISWRDLPLHFPNCLYFKYFLMPNQYSLE